MSDLLSAFGERTNYFLPSDVFGALAKDVAPFAGMTYDSLGLKGAEVAGARTGASA